MANTTVTATTPDVVKSMIALNKEGFDKCHAKNAELESMILGLLTTQAHISQKLDTLIAALSIKAPTGNAIQLPVDGSAQPPAAASKKKAAAKTKAAAAQPPAAATGDVTPVATTTTTTPAKPFVPRTYLTEVIKGKKVDPNVSAIIAKAKTIMTPAELAEYESKATGPKDTYLLNYIIKHMNADYLRITGEYTATTITPEPLSPRT
jgi:hypothetical protein